MITSAQRRVLLMLRPPHHARNLVALTIVSWAVGESAAITGAIVVLLGAPLWSLLLGYAMFYISTRANPVPPS